MKLFRLLQLDSIVEEGALPRNFGDSYLIKNNTIFRNIRKGTIESGYSFDGNPNSSYLPFR